MASTGTPVGTVSPVKSELYRERLPATPAAVRRARLGVADALARAGIADGTLLADIALTVSEATANAVRHAYPSRNDGHVEVSVARTAEAIVITVTDEGRGIKNAVSDTRGLGIGLALMHAQTDSMEVESNSTGTVVTLRFTAPGPDQPPPP
jgi:anti-sigma regulatory factor (Ser/Thr protein kinase)